MPPKKRTTNNSATTTDALLAAIAAQDKQGVETSNSYVLGVIGANTGDFYNEDEDVDDEEDGENGEWFQNY